MEDHDVIQAVDELGAEGDPHHLHHRRAHPLVVLLPGQLLNDVRAQIGGQDDDGVAEVHRPSLAVRQAPIVHDLQEDVEDVRVGLLHLVHQDDAVGAAAHRLGQVAALLVADIARWGADEARHRVLLHELGHVDAHHGLFGIEEEFGQGLAQFGLADAGGAEEEEGADGPHGIGQAGAGAADGVADRGHRLTLAHHPLAQLLLHAQELVTLALQHA